MKAYTSDFYGALTETSEPSARIVWPKLLALAPIKSAVDFGSGDGSWLSELRKLGVTDTLGIDGPWISPDQVKIPKDTFRRMPLEEPIKLERRFDLACSLEVAEHLTPPRAPGFVADLCAAAPLVMFSAAAPKQGGVNHYNEQWPKYWAALFAAHGYRAVDCLRLPLMDDPGVMWWYAQNIVLYAAPEAVAKYPKLAAAAESAPPQPASLIHPAQYLTLYEKAHPRFGEWLKMGSAAFRRSFKKKKAQA